MAIDWKGETAGSFRNTTGITPIILKEYRTSNRSVHVWLLRDEAAAVFDVFDEILNEFSESQTV
jgi:hypothetical protein